MRKRILVPALATGTLLAAGVVRTAVELRERYQQKRKFVLAFQRQAAETAGYIWGWYEAAECDGVVDTVAGEALKKQVRQTSTFSVRMGSFGCYSTVTFSPTGRVLHFEVNGDVDSLGVLHAELARHEQQYLHLHRRELGYTTLFFNVIPTMSEDDEPTPTPRMHTQPARPYGAHGERPQT